MVNETQPTGGNWRPDRVYRVHSGSRPGEQVKPSAEKGDKVEISAMAYWHAKIAALPEVRTEKIAAAREQIANNTYEKQERLDAAVDNLLDDLLRG